MSNVGKYNSAENFNELNYIMWIQVRPLATSCSNVLIFEEPTLKASLSLQLKEYEMLYRAKTAGAYNLYLTKVFNCSTDVFKAAILLVFSCSCYTDIR